jgi:hypothetical protein
MPRRRTQAARNREMRYNDRHRQRRLESWRRSSQKHSRTEKGRRSRQRRDELSRICTAEANFWYDLGLSIVGRRSPLKYIDPAGNLHHEEELSAEELIRRWKKAQKKKRKKRKDGNHP